MKFTPIRVVRKTWRRRLPEIEYIVNVDAENSVVFRGTSAERLAIGYCDSLDTVYTAIGIAMDTGERDPLEIRSQVVDYLFARTVNAFSTQREVA
jgi:hypothetical protein